MHRFINKKAYNKENYSSKKERKTNVVLLASTIIIFFFICELAIRVQYNITGKIIAKDDYELAQKELYTRLTNLSDPNRFYYGRTLRWAHDPVLGLVPNPGYKRIRTSDVAINETHFVKIRSYGSYINLAGMTNMQEFNLTKPPDTLRIACLGDSYTIGDDVQAQFNFPNLVKEMIPDSEVLNFGMSGKGTEYMYIVYMNRAKEYNPDVVIMNIFIGDLSRNGCGNKLFFRPQVFLDEQNNLKIKEDKIPTYQEFLESYTPPKMESYFIKMLLYKIHKIKEKNNYEYGLKMLGHILDSLKKETKGNLIVSVFLGAPNEKYNREFEYIEDIYMRLTKMLQEKQIPYIDGAMLFLNEIEKYEGSMGGTFFHMQKTGHFSEVGNAVFANAIKQILEKRDYVPETDSYYAFYYSEKDNALLFLDKNLSIRKTISGYDLLEIKPISHNMTFAIVDEVFIGDETKYTEKTIIT